MLALLTLSPAYVVPHAALRPASACLRPQSDMSVPLERRAVAPLDPRRRAVPPQLTSLQTAEEVEVPAELESNEPMPMEKVLPRGCPSCEDSWLKTSRETEAEETARLAEVAKTNLSEVLEDIWDYAQRMNDTQRQEVALIPDTDLRNFIIASSSPPSLLMEKVYNATMERVPYEQACYICGPEQAMLLRTMVGLAQPRRCLDIGSFTGYTSSAVLEALPEDAELTCLEIEEDFTNLALENLGERNVKFLREPAIETLTSFEEQGRQFDFITLDADKPMHGEYYNASLRLLRPGGLIVMFGMLLFPTVEDQEAMEKLHEILPNDTRISTAQLPVGCGMQLMVKLDRPDAPLSEAELAERRKYELESELAAIDRHIASLGVQLGGAGSVGPGTEALSSKGLVAMQAARRAAEAAAAEAMAEAELPSS